jgi:hypothetical protein
MPVFNTTGLALFTYGSDGLLQIKADNGVCLTATPPAAADPNKIDLHAVVGLNQPARLQAVFTAAATGYVLVQQEMWPVGCEEQAIFLIGSVYPDPAVAPMWPAIRNAHYPAGQPNPAGTVCSQSLTVTFDSHGLIEIRTTNSVYTINVMGAPKAKDSYLIAFGGKGTIELDWIAGAKKPALNYDPIQIN